MTEEVVEVKNYLFKTIVVGDGGVGKSTMIQRLITGQFVPMKITIGTDLASYQMQFENKKVKLQIWDFAGEKRFRFFLPNYARGAMGCLLCYDINRYSSFQNLQEWYDIVMENSKDPIIVLVGCKLDLEREKRSVKLGDAEKFQSTHNIAYFIETSSKTGENNFNVFEILTKEIIRNKNLD
ncbi:MAG: Rab family GTPase [Candidatus Thorarchaeota archaeon]